MKNLYEGFFVFIQSSFSKAKKEELYDFIWKNYHKRISFYISNIIPATHPFFEDLIQDVMLKIYNNLQYFNPLHSFKAWLYKIARNQCLDFIKSKKNSFYPSEGIEETQVNVSADPENLLIKNDLIHKIDQFMNSLDGADREIAYFKFYENLKYQQICKILEMNINTVKSRVRSIKKRIREKLKI